MTWQKFLYTCLKNTYIVSVFYSLSSVKNTHAEIRMFSKRQHKSAWVKILYVYAYFLYVYVYFHLLIRKCGCSVKAALSQICNNQKQYSRVNLRQNMALNEKKFKKWFCNGELCDVKNNVQKVYQNPSIRKPNNFGVKKVFFFLKINDGRKYA